MGQYKVVIYPKEMIPRMLEEFLPFMERSAKESFGMVTVEGMKGALLRGDACAFTLCRDNEIVLMTVVDFMYYATYKAARVIGMAGEDVLESAKLFPAIEAWVLTQGAVEIEGWCRPSVARLLERLGLEKRVTIMVKDLRGKLQ